MRKEKCTVFNCDRPKKWIALCTGRSRCTNPEPHRPSYKTGYCDKHIGEMSRQMANDFVDFEKFEEGELVFYEEERDEEDE